MNTNSIKNIIDAQRAIDDAESEALYAVAIKVQNPLEILLLELMNRARIAAETQRVALASASDDAAAVSRAAEIRYNDIMHQIGNCGTRMKREGQVLSQTDQYACELKASERAAKAERLSAALDCAIEVAESDNDIRLLTEQLAVATDQADRAAVEVKVLKDIAGIKTYSNDVLQTTLIIIAILVVCTGLFAFITYRSCPDIKKTDKTYINTNIEL